MEDNLKLVGRTSNEIFVLRYPSSILGFCDFDLSYFAKLAIEACGEAQKTGQINPDVFSQLRRDLQSAHCYIGHNIRTIYEKVAVDCWIDYLCRRDNIGTGTLWNRYITCRTPFDKLVFSRLCELRYNRAINEWLNIVRVQDYAKSKIDFVFTKDVKNAKEAASRRNYFDLIFSVTAREMGCRLEDLGEIKVFSVGRTPSSPFMFSTISKDIVRHVLADFDYSDDYSDVGDYSEISDQIAMDAFSKMKAGLPAELSSYNIIRGKMENYTERIYMPCSLKAAIDLEIDAIIESGGILCACKRCGRLYLRNEDYNEDYCRTYLQNGKSCLEIYREEHPAPTISPEIEQKIEKVTNELYSRVGSTMSLREYESWRSYMNAMCDKVASGEITPEELESFLDYSQNVDISRSKPIVEVPKRDERPSRERVVKPFIPERISRSDIAPKPKPEKPDEPEEEAPKDGFFTSPTVFKRKNEGQQISHIIRASNVRGYPESAVPNEFQPFGQQFSQPTPEKTPERPERPEEQDISRLEKQLEEDKRIRELFEQPAVTSEPREKPVSGGFVPFAENNDLEEDLSVQEQTEEISENKPARSEQKLAEPGSKPEETAEAPSPKPRVIRKNAAAISAYGKMSGAPVSAAPPEMELISPKPDVPEKPDLPKNDYPEEEPFKDIGSIFDILEQSENDMSGKPRKPRFEEDEPSPEWERSPLPQEVTKENAPSGIWTEDRKLFNDTQSELDMLKEKKHAKTNKTRRLYDVIMREPDDNPNFRRKK